MKTIAHIRKTAMLDLEIVFSDIEIDISGFTNEQKDSDTFIVAAEMDERRKQFGGTEWNDMVTWIKSHITPEQIKYLLENDGVTFECGLLTLTVKLYDYTVDQLPERITKLFDEV
ncbi:MAG: hypothetical protein M0Q91_16490 [Methanoregula sp.]|jgi:hypothetical protein|nr:hypothetical protein [Methanoregula sp.]